MEVRVQFKGLREIGAAIRALPSKVDRKVLNDGLVAGAKIVQEDAIARAPELQKADPRRKKGLLKRSIRVTVVRPTQYAATVWVRVRRLSGLQVQKFKAKQWRRGQRVNAADNPNDPFFWRFVEFGTSKMAARSFLRPAFNKHKEAAVRKAIDVFREKVQAAIEKLRR